MVSVQYGYAYSCIVLSCKRMRGLSPGIPDFAHHSVPASLIKIDRDTYTAALTVDKIYNMVIFFLHSYVYYVT